MILPIFPLNTVIFPGGCLPLRIFEPRYLEMVKNCVQNNESFVVSLIQSGAEVSSEVKYFNLGTECEIIDWETTPDGLLGITVSGMRRVMLNHHQIASDGLNRANTVCISELPDEELPDRFSEWRDLLRQIIQKLGAPFAEIEPHYESADWVGARLIEYLPIELVKKQELLSLDHPIMRLERLVDSIDEIEYYLKAGKFKSH